MIMNNIFYKNIILSFALIFVLFTLTNCTKPNTIRGYIEGLSNDTVFVMKAPLSNLAETVPIQDTIWAKDGRFAYTFPKDDAHILIFSFPQFFTHDRPTGGVFTPDNSYIMIFTEPGEKISFKGYLNSTGDLLGSVVVTGSELNRDFSPIQSKMFEINTNQVEEEMAIEQAMVNNNREAQSAGFAKRMERLNVKRELFSNYINANIDNPLSAFILTRLPLDSIGLYYDKLGESARNSVFRGMLDQQMEQYVNYTTTMKAMQEVIVGSKAPDFTLESTDGKNVTLSTLRGKYVIIDFWGSWCPPCIAGIPKMKSFYEKYKSKLEIVGVACREQSADVWQDAVKTYELPWINVYNDKLSDITPKYGIEGYPTKIVIDPEGTIVIRELGEVEDFYTKLESVIR